MQTSMQKPMQTSNTIVIVGGGPVGSVLALFLAVKGFAVTVLETRKHGASHQDNRALALSYGSKRMLEKLGLWGDLAPHATAINHIHVSQKGSIGRTWLHASDYQQQALGYVLSYGALSAALSRKLADFTSIDFIFEANAEAITPYATHATVNYTRGSESYVMESDLVVLADGGHSLDKLTGLTRTTKDYGHEAIISKVIATLPHSNIAYERFTPDGPMALLPNGGPNEFSLVWTGKKDQMAGLLQLSDNAFLTKFHEQFGDRVGAFLSVQKRMSFPLKMSQLKVSAPQEASHLVVIGNAAQTMHPVAGQGFNVGLRDAEALAQQIIMTDVALLGSRGMLDAYHASRKADTKGGLMFTDFLVNIFSNEILGLASLRGAGLGVLNVLKPVKKHLVEKMSFGK